MLLRAKADSLPLSPFLALSAAPLPLGRDLALKVSIRTSGDSEAAHPGRGFVLVDFFMLLATAFPFPFPLLVEGPAVGDVEITSEVSSVSVFLARLPGGGTAEELERVGIGGLARFLPFGLRDPAAVDLDWSAILNLRVYI